MTAYWLKVDSPRISLTVDNISSREKMEYQFSTLPLINGAFKTTFRRLKSTPY